MGKDRLVMGILDDAKKALGLGTAKKIESKKPKTSKKIERTEKELATENKEPWVKVVGMELDIDNPGNGAFELDWNEYFIKQLYKAGYRDEKEEDAVDRWFQDVCRNVVMETYQKDQADPEKRTEQRNEQRTDLGSGRAQYE
jgi:hypothetical protein